MKDDTFLILESLDNKKIEIKTSAAKKSNLLKGLMNDFEPQKETIKLPEIKSDVLKKIVEYLDYYKDKTPKDIPKPLPSNDLKEFLTEWDYNFINNIDNDEVFDLIVASNYMDIPSLLDLCCSKIASLVKGKKVNDIRKMFEIECDLTEEEIEIYEQFQIGFF